MNLGRRRLRRLSDGRAATGVGLAGAVALGVAWRRGGPPPPGGGRGQEHGAHPGARATAFSWCGPGACTPATSWRCAIPADAGRVLVKRVGAVLDDGIVVRGDNPGASTDSRSFGPVPSSAVLGRVVRCYAPSWRAGPVR